MRDRRDWDSGKPERKWTGGNDVEIGEQMSTTKYYNLKRTTNNTELMQTTKLWTVPELPHTIQYPCSLNAKHRQLAKV